jgi:hypothetical protein
MTLLRYRIIRHESHTDFFSMHMHIVLLNLIDIALGDMVISLLAILSRISD